MASDINIQLEFNIDVYKSFIVEHVKFSHLLSNIDCMRDHASKLHKLDRDGRYREAGELFLTVLKESDDVGRWQQFRDALQQEEYEHVVKLLSGDIGAENHLEKRKIIELFQQDVAKSIDPIELCNHLKGREVFSDIDEQQIFQLKQNHGDITASLYLLNNIWKKKINWYEEFLTVLTHLGREHVARLIDPDFVDKQQRRAHTEETDMDIVEASLLQGNLLHKNDIHCNDDTFGANHHLPWKTETSGQHIEALRHTDDKAPHIHPNTVGSDQDNTEHHHDLISPSSQSHYVTLFTDTSTGNSNVLTSHHCSNPPLLGTASGLLDALPRTGSTDTSNCGHGDCKTCELSVKTGQTPGVAGTTKCVCCMKTQEEIRNLKTEVQEMKELLSKLVLKK